MAQVMCGMNSTDKKIVLGILIVLAAVFSLVFRDQISQMLLVGESNPPVTKIPVQVAPSDTSTSGEIVQKPPQPAASEPQKTPPVYTGREPGEINPLPEEIKLFSQEQLRQIYSRIAQIAGIVKSTPSFFEGWINLGIYKKVIGDFAGARDAWEYASLIEPLNSSSFANLGELYWRYIHDYPKSETNFRTSLKHKPDPLVYVSLAELYHYSFKEKYDLADDVLLEGLKIDPNSETLLRRLAYLYEQREEYKEALKWWDEVRQDVPDDKVVLEKIEQLKKKIEAGP